MSELAVLVGGTIVGDGDPVVRDVVHDSRTAKPGDLYVAVRGDSVDGHAFVAQVVEAGAAAVCVDRLMSCRVPQLVVDNTRRVMGQLASAVHNYPSSSLDVVGVTGTNGKTTVTHYIESIAQHAGVPTGLVGTIHTRIGNTAVAAERTTPEATDFQRLLADMRDHGVSLVAAEISSHALVYGRALATRFAVAAFTNLSQDHLDFHGDMSSYRQAKERLFRDYEVGTAVINIDDPTGANIARDFLGSLVTVGETGQVATSHLVTGRERARFRFNTPWGNADVEAPVTGGFNVTNLTIAAACCLVTGIGFDAVVAGMGVVAGVPGRFEVVSGDDPITVIVDYAHTPEGVANAVSVARSLSGGRVIGLIGAGGDRDRAKRPAMGSAISGADLAIVTSDNPRSEDPEAIVDAVLSGLDKSREHIVQIQREKAIGLAMRQAEDGDIVLILGRGHEPAQEVRGELIPFDDRLVAAEALRERRSSAESGGASGSMTP